MRPEDQLDHWLDLRAPDAPALPLDLQAPMEAADRVGALASIEPSRRFAAALEAHFLAQARAMAGEDEHTAPERVAHASHVAGPSRARMGSSRRRPWRILWPTIAAVFVIAVSLGTLFAAASAAPGSPLYALHRWEQGVNVSLAGGPADRARLHLTYATDALAALDASVARHEGDRAYRDALSSFQDEMRSATAAVSQISDDTTRQALEAQLAAVRAQARDRLRAALPSLDWSMRVETTTTLAQVGDTVPQITQVMSISSSHDGEQVRQYSVTGSGFQPGAVLVVDGSPVGVTISSSPTTLVASVQDLGDEVAPHSIGVSNPDGSAAQTTDISRQDGNDRQDSTPSSQETPSPAIDQYGSGSNSPSATPQDGK